MKIYVTPNGNIWQPRAMEQEACLSSGLDVIEFVRRYIIYMREDICDGVCGKSRHVFVSKQVVELISHKLILSPTSHN